MGYKRLAVLAALFGVVGCTSTDLHDASGHYEGFRVSDGPSGPTQASIGGDLTIKGDTVAVTLQTEPASGIATTFTAVLSGSGVSLSSSSGALPATLSLTSGANNCYSDKAGDELCYDGVELTVLIIDIPAAGSTPATTTKYVLNRMNPGTATPPAPPSVHRPYSVDELVSLAQTRNFNTEVEFDTVMQAKLNAQESYLNLLPHINIGSGLDLIGFVPDTMIRAIGDLLPFFLPDRWFQAAAASDTASADFDAYRVAQAAGINVVQGLAYSVLRDEESLVVMQKNRVFINDIWDEVVNAEHSGSGMIQVGSSDEIGAVLNTLISEIDQTTETIAEEKTALSQATGFVDPLTVTEVEPISLPTINGPIAGSLADFQNSAVDRSIQLLQFDDLIQAAQKTKDAAYFQWLDPAGNDSESLGFGLISAVKVDSSQIQQLNEQKISSQSTLLQQVTNTLSSSGQISDQYLLAGQAIQLAQSNVNRLLLDFRTGVGFEMADLVTALQNQTQAQVGQINTEYAYLTLLAEMDFLTYSGPYAPLLGETWSNATNPVPSPSPSPSPRPVPSASPSPAKP